MRRLFDEHIKRKVTFLDGIWKFNVDKEDVGEEEKWYKSLPQYTEVNVPSVWNKDLGLFEYEGAAWYEKTFYNTGGTIKLVFEAVMTECKVWLDGEYIGYHYGGFCQFDFILRDIKEGYHTLTLKVDNRFDENSIPQKGVDWYHYGGITRSVSVENLTGISTVYQKFDYTLSDDLKEADIIFTAELYNADNTDLTENFSINLGNDCIYTCPVTLKAGETQTIVTDSIKISDVAIWDNKTPNLYDVAFITDSDDLFDRIGFRKIETRGNKIYLNNKPFEFRGVNRHEDHPDWGMAFPVGLMKRDLDIIEDLGCNTIRGSHYPNSRIFVDMLDSRGILFWSEIPIWGGGFSEEALGSETVVNRGLDMHKEMVKYYYNHPCIVFWGMHNEIKCETENALNMTKVYYKFLKENGGNRLVMYATHKPEIDICLEYTDVIGINKYYGWYSGNKNDWQPFLDSFKERLESLNLSDKPIIMSEFGFAAIYGHHTFDNVRWTEEYQAELLSHCLTVFHESPMICGYYIWQFTDMRSNMALTRVKYNNNKGLLNEYRNPKLSYRAVKEKYLTFKSEEN